MDILELGAIGELVGGVAVVGSLISVGLQVRPSNRLAQLEALQAYMHFRCIHILRRSSYR